MSGYREGDPVRYFPGMRNGRSALGRIRYGKPYTVGGTEGYYVTGIGFMAATHLEPLNYKDGVVEVATASEALEASQWDGFTDVVITDNTERIKMQKLLKGFRS